ncbi:MAG TPA: DNA polymerase III subunit gamma/tau, partial [Micropepsaceae bacterium]|nr:DNA polymerase III subunit gamma/tau [Micropepsaceae bacterium]
MTDERDEPSFDMAEAKKPSRRKTAPREEAATPVPEPAPSGPVAYRVLARKYRPQTFEALIGQEALVRTLANAFATGRIAHAFMLTGVRGVGKTTTARIIARALNCTGEDGKRTAPTITPCGVCEACVSIAESRNVDVQEMDAASRTGIDDIREIIEGVRYSPASARYKVYIIDEVHMLSRQAFNGLLKTLEEPPPHVKFIFATTEIRKVPVTVLSRCQRFDLKRIPANVLAAHLGSVAKSENITIDEAALALVARAADGSVRDGLSILDQAIAHADEGEGGPISGPALRAMLGLADRARVIDLFEAVMSGRIADALADLASQYDHGAEPLTLMQDLASFCHVLTRARVAPEITAEMLASEEEAARALSLAQRLSMASLTRAWSLLLKGIEETRDVERPLAAAEMALIRLAYAADLPPVDRLIAAARDGLKSAPATSPTAPPPSRPSGPSAM